MANTRQSTKRAGQAKKRQTRNATIRSSTKSAVRNAIETIQKKDAAGAKDAFMSAIKALSKAASKGGIPKGRAARKISRLTILAKKTNPEFVKSK